MNHPTYADTGEPVSEGEDLFIIWRRSLRASTVHDISFYGYGGSMHLADNPPVSLPENGKSKAYRFFKHRHNAIAAWEKLLEDADGN